MDNDITPKLRHLLQDESISVSQAAADALGRIGQADKTISALRNALQSDLLWARFRAAANLSYYDREQLSKMKSLIPDLQAALKNSSCYGREHLPYIESMFSRHSFNASKRYNRWSVGHRSCDQTHQVGIVKESPYSGTSQLQYAIT